MSADEASEKARFAAREFIARYVRETGQQPPVEFAYEIGYLRGRSDAALSWRLKTAEMFDDAARTRGEPRKDSDDDAQ